MLGADKVVRMPNPIMGAEDFSYVLQRVPGSMMFLGGTPPDHNPATAPANHSNRVVFDEDAMTDGIALYAGMALRHLAGGDRAWCVTDAVARAWSVGAGQAQRHQLERAQREHGDAVAHLETAGGSSSRLQRLAATIRRSARTITCRRSPHASWRRTTRSPLAVVGELDGVDLDPDAGQRHDRRRDLGGRPAHHPDGRVEPLGLAHDVGQPGPCGYTARSTTCRPWSASGSGYRAPAAG